MMVIELPEEKAAALIAKASIDGPSFKDCLGKLAGDENGGTVQTCF